MKKSGVLWTPLLCLLSNGSAKKGFILTAPKTLDAGTAEHLTFTAFELGKGALTVRLLHWYTDELIANTTVHLLVGSMSVWAKLSLPPAPADQRAKLRVEGTLGDGYRIDVAKEVLVRHSSVVTFVQTDKPLYKPGQTVRFRVLPLNSRLRPLGADTVADVWIEDPSNIRVSQWKKVQFTEGGMVQLELPLSDEPPLGEWTIHTDVRQVTHAHKFSVRKYVLPKFDVKINPPAFIMADANDIPLEICAWHSYGKKVDGTLRVKVTYKRYQWEEGKRKATPSVEHSGPISGCETVHVNTQDILLQTREFGFRTLEFAAEVTENATGVSGNATAVREVTHSPLKLQFLGSDGNSDYFKPGIPFYGELSVLRPNDVPVAHERIEICASYARDDDAAGPMPPSYYPVPRRVSHSFLPRPHGRRPASDTHCKVFAADKKGRVRFSVPPKSRHHTQITLEASAVHHPPVPYRPGEWAEKLVRPSASFVLRPWHSPSGHQLQIEARYEPLECGGGNRTQLHRVRYTAANGTSLNFYHQVASGGRIVQQGSHQRTHHPPPGEKEDVLFDLGPADPSPSLPAGDFLLRWDPRGGAASARLLVFHVRPDGEIVADSRKFRIRHCLDNKVGLRFRHDRQYPNTDAAFLLSAAPDSVCGIGLVDQSVTLLGRRLHGDRQLDEDGIFRALEKLDVGREQAPHQVSEDHCVRKAGAAASAPPPPSRHFHRRLSRRISLHVDTAMAFEEAGMVVLSDFDLETRPCVESQPIAIAYNRIGPASLEEEEDAAIFHLRVPSSRPPMPIPDEEKDEEEPPPEVNTADEIRSYFPETWLWEMHTVGPSGETALRRRLPHTLTRWVGGAVCVHAQTGLGVWSGAGITAFQPFFLSLTLPYSVVRGEGLPLPVTVFNYLSECLPIRLSLEPSPDFESDSRFHSMCVCGGESRSHRFVVRPRTLGRVDVTVYGFSMEEDDACGPGEEEGGVATARLGARDALTRQIEVEAEGFRKEETFNYFVCPETTNGSYATEVDLLLPEDVVEGSARAYVSVTGDLLGPSLLGLGGLVRMPVGCGEQNMVLFAPNVFVLEYLKATDRLTREVEEECLRNMKTGYQRELQYRHPDGSYSAFGPARVKEGGGSLWLTAFVVRSFGQAGRFIDVDADLRSLSARWILGRQFENGCFEPAGFMLNAAMKGGLSSKGNPSSLAPLTGYVLISLLESGALRPEQPPVRSALSCLRSAPNPSSYALALFTYAALLAKEPAMAEKYFRQLESRATVKGSHQYWEEEEGGGASVGVETAAYFVLARMTQGGREAAGSALPAVRWIVQQRNAHGGFVSTQDTVVALQALALYSSLQQTPRPLDMGLVVEGDDLVKGFKLEEGDRMVTRTARIPTLPAALDLQAVGEGCALVQFSLRYNVAGATTASEAFDLRVDVQRERSPSCHLPTIVICMRYIVPDQTSNMVVATVKMASGYAPDELSLDELQSDPVVQLMRHEVKENQLHLYFNELTNAQKCFKFSIRQELEVDDIKPSSVKLFDYYQPELEVTAEYSIPSVCTTSSLLPWTPNFPEPAIGTTRKTEADTTMMSQLPDARSPPTSDDENEISDTNRLHIVTPISGDMTHAPEDEASRAERPSTEATEADEMASEGFTSATVASETLPGTTAAGTTTSEVSSSAALGIHLIDAAAATGVAGNRPSEEADKDASRGRGGKPPHLRNFVEAEEDPDFPEGTEGNRPAYALPSGNSTLLGCPVCAESFPGNFTEIYCSSTLTLQIHMRDGISATIEYDLSYYLPQQKPIGKFVKLDYDASCPCHQLHRNGSTLLVVGRRDLWDTGTQTLHLDKTAIIVSFRPAHSTDDALNCP